MIDLPVVAAFVPAVMAVIVSPGPDSIYTVTQSLSSGRAAGVAAAVGTATGVLVHAAAAVLGLSAILRTTAEAYTVMKYVGAAYLVYLGVQLLRDDETFEIEEPIGAEDRSLVDSYRKAVTINVTNPQVAVFVLAFFPQFVPATADAGLQLSVLGAVYAGLSLLYLAGVALFADRVRHLLLGSTTTRRVVRYASGSVLVGFGLRLALDEGRTP
ncbi:LysE family translocator [Halorubrum sp. Boch-26]|uniref:LysE family translocator n=1 Tax=Halorubrum sp. Boch-26 TaxID=2994426 RepID=UPI002468B41C|nr:LysE family translocator [Halorubrum sp. Boch-26]